MSMVDVGLAALIAGAVALAVRSMVRTRRRGGCAACPYAGSCGHAGSSTCEGRHD